MQSLANRRNGLKFNDPGHREHMPDISLKRHRWRSSRIDRLPKAVDSAVACAEHASLCRMARCSWLLTILVFPASPLAQQAGGSGQTQAPQAVQLPSSGRATQSGGSVNSQQMTSEGTGASVVQPSVTVTGNYQGSVAGPAVPSGPLRLSLADAVKRGLQANLGIVTAGVSSSTIRAERAQALSQLFPQITASIGITETQINLAAYGLNELGSASAGASPFPTIVGPFHYVQAQGNLTWNALSLTNYRNYQAANSVYGAARLGERDARELVVVAVGGTYLQVISAAARVDAQRVQVNYAQATYDRALTQLTAGTNTRVDVTRSLVQLQSEKERLLAFEGDYQQQKIAFARLIGLPQDAHVTFTEQLAASDLPPVDEMGALRSALEHRWDLRSAEAQTRAAEKALSAARGERLPSVSFNGDYGAMGTRPTESHGVFVASGTLSVPVFDGGKISADVHQAQATLRQRQAEYEDQKGKVEQDVRNAVIQLRTSMGQVQLAESNRKYARETLTQVQDRFDAGVTNTVEVVQAQQQEAGAENDYISSLFALNLARLSLARATGDAEADLATLFPGK
jgi:outer membrane protein TolC